MVRASDEAEAIRLANDTEYGLAASVFTRDAARGLRVARQVRSGHLLKGSGYGRFGVETRRGNIQLIPT